MSITKIIQKKYPIFSTKQKLIADYLIENEGEISFKTLKEISYDVGVTQVTVINFCKSLGFRSFIELKEQYRKEMIVMFSPTKKIFENVTDNHSEKDMLEKIVEQQQNNHQSTLLNLNEQDVLKTVDLIVGARKVYIFCRGLSTVIGNYLKIKLENLSINTEIIDLSKVDTPFMMKLLKAGKQDLFVCITFPIYSQIVLKICDYLNSKKYNIVGMTDKASSPLTKYSDTVFFCENDSLLFYNSLHTAFSIVEILISMVQLSSKEKLMMIKKDVEEIEKEFSDFLT